MEDSKIIDLFLERSEQAIAELDRKHGAAVKKTAMNILNNIQDTEECANDTYLGVWNTVPPQHPNPLVSYVCRIARNLAIKRYRANTALKRKGNYDLTLDELEECIPSSISLEDDYTAKELSAAVSRFLDGLSYEDRFCFIRRYWFVDSVADIAGTLHWKPHRVSVRLSRIREKLKQELKEEGLIE
ncbi:MAG: sigma-70 family RNA polymerase sigma factor [Oscillospiraceae bacterium]|nr:sigma-70 family RNA polymerase sigma factor [Oscillospiraceae bacterium]MBP5239908.1 sigma-70 family RNA polymerase sigma factor [Oscillospiraceae bacterium]